MNLEQILNLMSPEQQERVNLRTNTLSVVLGVKNAAGLLITSAIRRAYTINEMISESVTGSSSGALTTLAQPNNKDHNDDTMGRFESPPPDRHFVYSPPHVDMDDREVEEHICLYPDRPDGSFVVSGPIGEAPFPGKRFYSLKHAERGQRLRHGSRFIRMVDEVSQVGVEPERWAALVRKP